MASTVQPEVILRELADLWTSLAAPPDAASGASSGVLRACSMTLIVAAASAEDATDVTATVGELMHEHPSRAIILKPGGESEALDSRVYAQCWMPFGGRQQICCEQIEITTPDAQLTQMSRVILGLLAPDLPAVLWCRGEHWFERRGFHQLYPLIDKIVLDSCSFSSPDAAFDTIRSLRSERRRVADLSWSRLTMWREMIAGTLEVVAPGKRLDAIRSIVVEHYGDTPAAQGYYLGAWLSRALSSATIGFKRVPGEVGHVASVILSGEGVDVSFRRLEGDTVQVSGAQSNIVVLPHASDYRAMREELTITGADPTFEEVFMQAEELRSRS